MMTMTMMSMTMMSMIVAVTVITMVMSILDIQQSEEGRPWLRHQQQRGSLAEQIKFSYDLFYWIVIKLSFNAIRKRPGVSTSTVQRREGLVHNQPWVNILLKVRCAYFVFAKEIFWKCFYKFVFVKEICFRKPLLWYSRCSVPQGVGGKSTCRPPARDGEAFDDKSDADQSWPCWRCWSWPWQKCSTICLQNSRRASLESPCNRWSTRCWRMKKMQHLLTVGMSNSISSLAGIFT